MGNTGSISRENAKRIGPPFAATSADNGLSVDPVTGRIVLGNDVAAAGNPAQLSSPRQISMDGSTIQLTQFNAFPGQDAETFFNASTITTILTPANNSVQWSVGPLGAEIGMNVDSAIPGNIPPRLNFVHGQQLLWSNVNGDWVGQDVATLDDFFFAGPTGIETNDPGFTTGTARWKLGNLVVAAAALDATQFLEVEVGGTIFRLALIV